MKILPLDLRQPSFKRSWRGFSTADVTAFLEAAAVSFEEVVRDNQSLRDEVVRLQEQLQHFREKENTLKEALITAQKISADMRVASQREADVLVQEAELKADRILSDAHQKMIKVMDRIQEVKLERDRFATSLRALIEQHLKLLDATVAADKTIEKVDENLAFLKTSARVNETQR